VQIAIALYPGFTALDAIGPYQVLSLLPGAKTVFTAVKDGPIRDDTALTVQIDTPISELPAPDIIVVPGGLGTRRMIIDGDPLIDWIRSVHETTTWTTSVCTGSLLLAAAGVLDGLDATTHWLSYQWLERLGAKPTAERVVKRGKIITAAGVSSGIDMGLVLANEIAGPDVAQAIQLGIEYDPQPPFDSGSPAKAPAAITDLVRSLMTASEQRIVADLGAGG
jgi:transcriptional regulator GlxA family with amidase domain